MVYLPRMAVFDVLRRAVETCGLSHAEIARRAGIEQSQIHKLMAGQGLREHAVEALAKALGLALKPTRTSKKKGDR